MHPARVLLPFAAAASLAGLPCGARAGDCDNPATQSDINACADRSFTNADAELNHAYRDVLARLKADEEKRRLLVDAQRSWIAFRDAECAFSASAVKQGSIYPSVVQTCRVTLTWERLRALKSYLVCAEGDLGCPVPRN